MHNLSVFPPLNH